VVLINANGQNILIPSPQAGWCMFTSPSLETMDLKWTRWGNLVKMLASCSSERMGRRCRGLTCIFSQTMWQSSSMCLVLSWKLGLWAMCLIDFLSQYRVAMVIGWTTKSWRRYKIHYISQTVATSAQYSTSVDDQETICCFFDFHEISEVLDDCPLQCNWLSLVGWGQLQTAVHFGELHLVSRIVSVAIYSHVWTIRWWPVVERGE